MTRSLITGSTGFIGSHLALRLIKQGDTVRCLARENSSAERLDHLRGLGAEIVIGDVKDPESLVDPIQDAEVVYHLAGRTKAFPVSDFYRVNEIGAESVAATCSKCEEPPTLVLVSSLAAAGPSPASQPRDEKQPCEPVSHYGLSKRAGELAVAQFAGQVPISIVRPPIVFGPGDADGFMLFKSIAERGIHAVPGSRDLQLAAVAVENLTRGLALVAERGERLPVDSDATGEGVYFIADEELMTGVELGNKLKDALQSERVRVITIPKPVLWLAAAISGLVGTARKQPTILNLDKYQEMTAGHWTCSAEKIRTQLGYQTSLSMNDCLEETAAWYRAEGWL